MLAGQLADAVGGDGRAVGIGFVVERGQRVDQVEVVAFDDVEVVIGLVAVGDHLREFGFVESRVGKTDGTGVDRSIRQPGHHGDHGTGVDAAGEEGAERHFGDHPQADGFFEAMGQFGAGIGVADRVVEGEADVPVFPGFANGLPAPQQQRVGGRQFFGLLEDGARFGNVAEGEVFLDRARVDVALEAAVGQKRLEFGAEDEAAVVEQRVVQGFDAEAVAGEKQGLAIAVPEGEGKHAAKAVDAVFAPGFPGVDDDFGVAAGVEDVAQCLQFRDEFLVVVDFAVENDADALVFVVQRLLAGRKVDDREAPVAKPDAGFDMQTAFVRTAVELRFVHAVEHRTVDVALASGVENAGYSAHGVLLIRFLGLISG